MKVGQQCEWVTRKLKAIGGAPWTGQASPQVAVGIFAGAFLGLALLLGAVGCLYLGHLRTNFRHHLDSQLATIAQLKVRQIVAWRQECLGDGEVIMRDPFLAESLQEFLAAPAQQAMSPALLARLNSLREHDQSRRLLLFGPALEARFAMPAAQADFGPSALTVAQEALRSHQVVMSDLHRGVASGEIHLDLAIPIYAPTPASPGGQGPPHSTASRVVAVLELEVNPDVFLYPLLQSWPVPERSGETLLARREGSEVLYLNELRHQTNTALILRLPLTQTNTLAVQAALGCEGRVGGTDYLGKPVVGVIRSIPDTAWHLVAQVDQKEAFGAFRRDTVLVSLAIVSAIAVTGLGLGVWWRQREAGFLKEELELEKERQWLTQRLLQISRQTNDILLLYDRQKRLLDANDRAVEAYGYSLEELRGLSAAVLRSPETRPELEALWARLDQEKGLRVESVHRRKDGSVFPVEVSLRLVVLDGEQFYQVFVRDITERKKTEAEREFLIKSLEEALANVKTLSGLIPICASCKKIRDDKGYWNQVESYVAAHSEARFSHGICPECAHKLYPEFAAAMGV